MLSRAPPPPRETWALRSAATPPTPSAGFPWVGASSDMSSSFLIQGSSGLHEEGGLPEPHEVLLELETLSQEPLEGLKQKMVPASLVPSGPGLLGL